MKLNKIKRQTKTTSSAQESDPYLEAIYAQWSNIIKLYRMLKDRQPILVYDIINKRINAHPYLEFKATMISVRDQELLQKEYKNMLANKKLLIYIEDHAKRKLILYSFPLMAA